MLIDRRRFLIGAGTIAGAGALAGIWHLTVPTTRKYAGWPRYILRRARDELFIELTAKGFRERSRPGSRWLEMLNGPDDAVLIFSFQSQHFAETAIAVSTIPPVVTEEQLAQIELVPSEISRIVLRPQNQRVPLTLSSLLDWSTFDQVLPDLDQVGAKYSLDIKESAEHPFTRVEMPWGISLTPLESASKGEPPAHRWVHSVAPQARGPWNVLWTTSLEGKGRTSDFEVLGVRGFRRGSQTGSAEAGDLKIQYTDEPGTKFPKAPTPLRNQDLIDIGATLMRRFPYTGRVGPPPIESAVIQYLPSNTCITACYADGRSVSVDQFRISARGGWLSLEGKWIAFPGCGLTGWTHTTAEGRDHHVEVIDAGFLYPFGNACELIVLSERVFVRDDRAHFVAILIKQVFLQIPQPNDIDVGHEESFFRSIAIATKRTPPLDLPAGGDPGTYRDYDFFLPLVGGLPFRFEHVGTDWAAEGHRSSMPMYFVSNKARSANGLIWEPGYPWNHTQQNSGCGGTPGSTADAAFSIPKSGDGLRVLDRLWNTQPHRFTSYGGNLIAIASPGIKGDTSQRIEWAEWVRGNIPEQNPSAVVTPPFRPRNRTFRLRLEGIGQMSGQNRSSLATYRDVRFVQAPLLDPEPTLDPKLYFLNTSPGAGDPERPYAFLLETRSLLSLGDSPSPRSVDQIGSDVRQLYYSLSADPDRIPKELFAGLNNEIQFGRTANSEAVGGLAVPDTHICSLTRQYGPVGDASFNERRWSGYDERRKLKFAAVGRLDYAEYRLQYRSQLDVEPFDVGRSLGEVETLSSAARKMMGFAPNAVVSVLSEQTARAPQGIGCPTLGDLFGQDAQILPGLSFADVFRNVALQGADKAAPGERTAEPLTWNVRVTGIEWLNTIVGGGPGQISLVELVKLFSSETQKIETSEPIRLGVEASLNWTNDVFRTETIGPVQFTPSTSTRMTIDARSRVDLGVAELKADLSGLSIRPGKGEISAAATLSDFVVTVFEAIEIHFESVAFVLSADGGKSFDTKISSVQLIGPLSFINQITKILEGLGSDYGVAIDLSPERVRVGQTLRFPLTEGDPLFIGPAQVINLALSWNVMIPLLGRDVLSVGFGIASREKPLTIFVPPWYGGKAHLLLEATTKGCRLVEVSMEYGAIIPITWGIARGEASLMAGIFYSCEKDEAKGSGKVVMRAFVKAVANLTVAGIIHFCGLIYIALSYIQQAGRKVVRGESTVRVSIKIGFFRISYSFTAAHEEVSGGSDQRALASAASASPTLALKAIPWRSPSERSSIVDNRSPTLEPFGPQFDKKRRAAFMRVVASYVKRDGVQNGR